MLKYSQFRSHVNGILSSILSSLTRLINSLEHIFYTPWNDMHSVILKKTRVDFHIFNLIFQIGLGKYPSLLSANNYWCKNKRNVCG